MFSFRGTPLVWTLFLCFVLSASAQQVTPAPELKAYILGETQGVSLSGTISVSSNDPSVTSGTRDVQESDLVPLPSLPAGALPPCFFRGANGWIPSQNQGFTRETGRTDLAASSLSRSGQLTIGREIDEDGENTSTRYRGRLSVNLDTGDGSYEFTQVDQDNSEEYSFTQNGNVRVQLIANIAEAGFQCAPPSMQVVLPDPDKLTKTHITQEAGTALGVAADGAAKFAIVLNTPLLNEAVEFKLTLGAAASSGAAFQVSQLTGAASTVSSGGTFRVQPDAQSGTAVLIVTAPQPYPGLLSVKLGDSLRIEARQAGSLVASSDIRVYLPPLILIHGIWSSSATWQPLYNHLKESGYSAPSIDNLDYEVFHSLSFSSLSIQLVLFNHIFNALNACKNASIACAKVDLLGHSMGGLASRYYAEREIKGSQIHRIVTVATPHSGSPLASAFEVYGNRTFASGCRTLARSAAFIGWLAGRVISEDQAQWNRDTAESFAYDMPLSSVMLKFGRDIDGGGNHSLRPGVTESLLGPARSDYQTIAGVAPDSTFIENFFDFVLQCYGNGETVDSLLGPDHDTTVPYLSQRGGKDGPTHRGVIHSSTLGKESAWDYYLDGIFSDSTTDSADLEVLHTPIWDDIKRFFAGFPPAQFDQPPSAAPATLTMAVPGTIPQLPGVLKGLKRTAKLDHPTLRRQLPAVSAATPHAVPNVLGREDLAKYTAAPASALTITPALGSTLALGQKRSIAFQSSRSLRGIIVVGLGTEYYREIVAAPYRVEITPQGSAPITFSVIALHTDNTYSKIAGSYTIALTKPVSEVDTPGSEIQLSADVPAQSLPTWGLVNGQRVNLGAMSKIVLLPGTEKIVSVVAAGNGGYTVRSAAPGVGKLAVVAGNSAKVLTVVNGACLAHSFTRFFAPAGGGNISIAVTIDPNCYWSADHDSPNAVINFQGSGKGNGDIKFFLTANTSSTLRKFDVSVGKTVISVLQAPLSCSYQVKAPSRIGLAGGRLVVNVTASNGCPWNSLSNALWAQPENVAYSTGAGDSSFLIGAATSARSTDLFVAGLRIPLQQDAACSISLAVAGGSIPTAGGRTTITLTTGSNCGWSARTTAFWLRTVGASNGSGTASLIVEATANTGAARSAEIQVGDRTVTVNQAGATSPVAPPSLAPPAVNAASYVTQISPGGFFTIYGSNLSKTTRIWAGSDFQGSRLPTSLDGVSVSIGGKPAYIYYISPSQINGIVPAFPFAATVPVVLTNGSGVSQIAASLEPVSPGLFLSSNPRFAIGQFADGSFARVPGQTDTARLIRAGDTIVLYGTGFGQTTPAYPEGTTLSGRYLATAPVEISVGGKPCRVDFAGMTYPGLFQINIRLAADTPAGEARIVVKVGGVQSQQESFLLLGQ